MNCYRFSIVTNDGHSWLIVDAKVVNVVYRALEASPDVKQLRVYAMAGGAALDPETSFETIHPTHADGRFGCVEVPGFMAESNPPRI